MNADLQEVLDTLKRNNRPDRERLFDKLITYKGLSGFSNNLEAEIERWIAKQAATRFKLNPRIDGYLLRQIQENDTASALFLGPTGVGKTSAAHWLLVGRAYKIVSSSALAKAEKEHPLGQGAPPLVRECRAAQLLIIDDVGFERDVAPLQELLEYRYSKKLATIVTTGLTKDELQRRIGAPYVRRIAQQFAGQRVLVVDCHRTGGR